MKTIVFASTRKHTGKTSIMAGVAAASPGTFGYMKPLGDRLVYKKKKNWDHDASLMVSLLDLGVEPENITLGFDHAKLRYMYPAGSIGGVLKKMAGAMGKDRDLLFVEGGRDLAYGTSINLDVITVARELGGKLVMVVGGHDDTIIDDIHFVRNHIMDSGVKVDGLVINKVHDPADFSQVYRGDIEKLGFTIYGILPYRQELTRFTLRYLAERLAAGVIAGEPGLGNVVENILVGAMTAGDLLRHILFNKDDKLVITSGDRSDIIVTALESDTAGVILSNNIIPPANIIALANQKNIPLLQVPGDTFQVAKKVDDMIPLLTPENRYNIDLLTELVKANIDLAALAG